MIKNVVFDIGNVLVKFGWEDFFRKFGLTDEEYERVVKATVKDPAWNEIDRGVLSDEEVLAAFVKNDPEMEDKIREVLENINGLLTIFSYTRGWIKDLQRRGYKVYCLSNMSYKAVRECWDALSFIEETDGYILSCDVKVIKPDPAIYQCLFDKYKLNPSECVFFDDLEKNIEGANAAGMHGVVFKGVKEAEAALKALSEAVPFESKYKKSQRIAASVALLLIVLMYLFTVVLIFIKAPWAKDFLRISVGLSIVLPILAWIYIWLIGKLIHRHTIADFDFFEDK